MSAATSLKSLTLLGVLAACGVGLAPLGAAAGPLAIHLTPSMGHPVAMDLRDQIRFPRVYDQNLTGDPGTGLPQVRIIRKPVHPKPTQANR